MPVGVPESFSRAGLLVVSHESPGARHRRASLQCCNFISSYSAKPSPLEASVANLRITSSQVVEGCHRTDVARGPRVGRAPKAELPSGERGDCFAPGRAGHFSGGGRPGSHCTGPRADCSYNHMSTSVHRDGGFIRVYVLPRRVFFGERVPHECYMISCATPVTVESRSSFLRTPNLTITPIKRYPER
jgi:hypothetical protein